MCNVGPTVHTVAVCTRGVPSPCPLIGFTFSHSQTADIECALYHKVGKYNTWPRGSGSLSVSAVRCILRHFAMGQGEVSHEC